MLDQKLPPFLPPIAQRLLATDLSHSTASAAHALTKVSTAFPDAILAGGAVLSYKLGLPARDLDIFVPTLKPLEEVAARLGLNLQSRASVTIGHTYHRSNAPHPPWHRNGLRVLWPHQLLSWPPKPMIDLILFPTESQAELIAELRGWAIPLKQGIQYADGRLDLPPAMLRDLSNRTVSLLTGRIPLDDDGRARRYATTLAEDLGWPLVEC